LIPILYRLAKTEKIPMTKLVDQILRDDLHIRGLIDQDQVRFRGEGSRAFPENYGNKINLKPERRQYHERDHQP
jgi:hypothetical protein